MAKTLHIFHGQSALGSFKAAHLDGVGLAWDDLVHEGPWTPTGALVEDSRRRAQWLAQQFNLTLDETQTKFNERDRIFAQDWAEIVLWSCRDVHDLGHLMQLGALLIQRQTPVYAVFHDFGFGLVPPDAFADHLSTRQPISRRTLQYLGDCFTAYRAGDADRLWSLRDACPEELPYVPELIQRLFEEFPDVRSGLSRSQRQLLEIAAQPRSITEAFGAFAKLKDPMCMGDWSFFTMIRDFCLRAQPLLTRSQEVAWLPKNAAENKTLRTNQISLTALGHAVLQGNKPAVVAARAMGGFHFNENQGPRWDAAAEQSTPPFR